MLVVIVGTGNHFVFDAALGGLVVLVGWLVARMLVAEPSPEAHRLDERQAEPCCS
jgi:hypothetical protein